MGGMAGGQETETDVQMRPSESFVLMRSLWEKSASRIEIVRLGAENGSSWYSNEELAENVAKAVFMRSKSISVFSVDIISTNASRSAYSGSILLFLKCLARSSQEHLLFLFVLTNYNLFKDVEKRKVVKWKKLYGGFLLWAKRSK